MSQLPGITPDVSAGRTRIRDFLPALALLAVTVSGFGALSTLPSQNEREVAVLFAPRVDIETAASLVASAGGELVDSSRFPNLVIATSTAPGFIHALYKAGAWLVMDPIVAHGCGATVLPGRGSN